MRRKKRKNYDEEDEEYEGGGKRMISGNNQTPAPKPSMQLVDAFERAYEAAASEHMSDEVFTIGRIREYFQAYVLPKMPDPLSAYLEELECRGYRLTSSFDGSPSILVRNRISHTVTIDENEAELKQDADKHDDIRTGTSSIGDIMRALPLPMQENMPVYTDDWEDDLSDLPPFEEEEED